MTCLSLSIRLLSGILLVFLQVSGAAGQEGRPGQSQGAEDVSFAANFVPAFQFNADIDGGAEFSASRYLFLFERSKRIDGKRDLGLSLFYDHEDYDFNGSSELWGTSPWNEVHRAGLGVSFGRRLESGWRLGFAPSVELSGESGAERGHALVYGGILSAGKRVSPALTLGFGAGVYYRLEETKAFPFLLVNWKISDRLRLGNPLRAGPSGPAGLELVLTAAKGWDIGFGGAWRSVRFRLDGDGVAPDGIGEVRSIPAWLRLSHGRGSYGIDVYAGAAWGGKLIIENERGGELGARNYDPAPFAALHGRARF
ncbi:MAG: hypothetical protein IH610_12870 [Deltaproteobacteria bacterium]|nr:hypothetical protein [Deltaproteobacteria bacterium]